MNPNSPKKPPGKNPAGNAGAAPAKTGANVKPLSPTPKPAPPAPVNPPPLYRLTDWIAFTLTAVLAFLGYLWTIAPDLTLQDCGELSVGSFYAGVPHPPGYPVWTIYTWLFTLLPIGNIAYRVAISSAVAGALCCWLFRRLGFARRSIVIAG